MGRRDYEIAFVGLQPGVHNFEYTLNEQFFEAYQQQDFTNCTATIKLTLEKNNAFMLLKFEVDGNLLTNCDRCGNELPVQLWDEFNLVVKLVENPDQMNKEEENPDVYYITRTEGILHIKDWLFEFVTLSIPMQKECAENDKGESTCNKKVLDMLKNLTGDEKKVTNPIWKGLENFKDLEN